MSIKISDIKTILTSPGGINLLIVKVETNQDGLYGLGCATFSYRVLSVANIIDEYLKPLLIGREVNRITEIWHLINNNAYWRNGPILNNAISGIDMALWDIKGKLANLPCYELFGGKVREGIKIYKHIEGKNKSEIFNKISYYLDKGIDTFRIQLNGYGGESFGTIPKKSPINSQKGIYIDTKNYIKKNYDLIKFVRKEFGDNIDLIFDVHGRLNLNEVVNFSKMIEEFNIFFLEDAIKHNLLDDFKQLRNSTIIPLAQGELFNNLYEVKKVIENKYIDYIRLHISQIGGITPTLKIQNLAENFGIKTAWHCPGDISMIGSVANLHLDISSVNFGIQEWAGFDPPNFIIQNVFDNYSDAIQELFSGIPLLKRGYLYLNDKPGWGVDICEKKALKYNLNNFIVEWTQTRLLDGSITNP